jgi:hypothetical protein
MKDKLLSLKRNLELGVKLSKILNTVVFLVEGIYPTVLLRACRLRHVPSSPDKLHTENYEDVAIETLWNLFQVSCTHRIYCGSDN